ncbi:hypothetical protein POM88_043710 [Heracleum sosnowskyi]|uniref:Uncharacterized protein n=1 Tax=Heracleum sosnowskyi TaxID=360622 RepID=A0AAD8M3B4_9APIA|nr:hypothetical protein POM88_043710 [Heracleum sosnowskyi]
MAFINAWASASRVGVHEVIPPSFVLPSKIPVRPSSGIFKLVPHVDANSKLVTQRYVFNKNAISALKLKAKAPVGNDNSRENANQFWVSKVEVVSAIIWKALISIAREKHGHLIPSVMVQNLNLRGRTSPLMPDNTCGNFYSVATARSTPDQSNIELHFLVALIRDAIRRTIHGYSKSELDSDEFFSTVTSKFNEARDEMQRPVGESHFIWCSSWCKIPFYEADFGWGKPSWISNACRIAEMVTLQDTKSGEGVEAWVTLKGVHEAIPPSFVLPSKIPVRAIKRIFKVVASVDPNSKLVTQRYVSDKNAISSLKLKAKAPVGNDNSGVNANQFLVSKVEVGSAIIWKALINIAREKHRHLIPSIMVPNLNLRGRTFPPVPDNTCGNFCSVARDEMQRPAGESHFIWCISWCKIPYYEAYFGWGKPSWMSNGCRIAEMVTLQNTKSEEGVEH